MESSKQRKTTRDAEGSIIRKEVERRTANGRTRKVTVFVARVRYTDASGKSREKKKQADTFETAKAYRRNLRAEVEAERTARPSDGIRLLTDAIDYYEERYVKEAEYSGDQKVSGLREPLQHIRRDLEKFRKEFAGRRLDSITYDDLETRKNTRLATPVNKTIKVRIPLTESERIGTRKRFRTEYKTISSPRAIASVNREMERLRRIFNISVKRGWLQINPFAQGDPLISKAAENERVRILSADEEQRLLAACEGRREHLKGIVTIAIDTFLRKNEFFSLVWSDVDLERRVIEVRALNSKTLKKRLVPISSRAFQYLSEMKAVADSDKVVSIGSVKKSFGSALAAAKIDDFTFHDLRGTGITRMLRAGVPAAEVMKMSGHTVWKTFMRYVKQDSDSMRDAANAIDRFYSAKA